MLTFRRRVCVCYYLQNLRLLNLRYDAIQEEYITMIATEVGMIPASSVPVILREYNTGPSLL